MSFCEASLPRPKIPSAHRREAERGAPASIFSSQARGAEEAPWLLRDGEVPARAEQGDAAPNAGGGDEQPHDDGADDAEKGEKAAAELPDKPEQAEESVYDDQMKQAERQLDQKPDEAEKSAHERGDQPENEERADDAAEKSKTHQENHSFGGGQEKQPLL